MIVVALVVSLPFLAILATRPVLRRLALRNAVRRPREALLVIAGSMLATALMTAAFVVGDTFNSSIRANAYTQLGPVDEIASVPLAQRGELEALKNLKDPNVDGVLDVVTTDASAATLSSPTTARHAAPKAQLLVLDFAAARAFGGDTAATGISGAGPRPGEAVVVAPLARRLHVRAGDTFTTYAFGNSVQLRVARVIPQQGLAGLWSGREVASYNAFVSAETITGLAAKPTQAAVPPSYSVLVSNRGGIEAGADHTDAVSKSMRHALGSTAVAIRTVKRDALDAAAAAGDRLTQLYTTLGAFAVFAGILLLVNIFRMLAEERQSELGMLRAMGLKRRSLVGAFASEGYLYALVACTVGTLLGLGVGRLVVAGAARIFSDADPDFRLPIRFTFTARSVQSGFVLGLVIALLTIVVTSVVIARLNIIAAIRDLDREKAPKSHGRRIVFGLMAAAGLALTSTSTVSHAVIGMLLGGALLGVGLFGVLRDSDHRFAVTVGAGTTVVWSVLTVPIAAALGGDLSIGGFFVEGIVLVVGSVTLVNEYQDELGHTLARLTGRSLSVRLGLAYPLARKTRTALTLAQFSIVVFVLTYISVITAMFSGQIDSLDRNVSAGFNVFVESNTGNPLPFAQLAKDPGIRAVAPLVTRAGDIKVAALSKSQLWPMTGIDDSFVRFGGPKLTDRGRFASDREAFRYLLSHRDSVIVDDFFLSQGAGPPAAVVHIGDVITVADPRTGVSHRLTVIAKGESDWLFNGGITSATSMRALFGDSAVANRAYVATASATSSAREIERRYFQQGAKADAIRSLLDARLSRQSQFFTLMRAFLALGLVIGIAGIGVIMVRAVRERRRQVGVLRALGFPAGSVARVFTIEAAFVALEGVVIGVVLGFVCTWSITLSDSFGEGLSFSIPWVPVALLVGGTLVGALLATLGPARSASKIKPAVALRIAD